MEKIVIIGASEHQAPLIEKAKEMGYETHVFAWQTGEIGEQIADRFYPISILKRDEILDRCRAIDPVAVVSVSSNTASATASYIARNLGQPANSETVYEYTGNKYQMKMALQRAGIHVPRFSLVGDVFSSDGMTDFVYPLIVKPVDRSNSRGLTEIRSESELLAAVMKARDLSYSGQVIIEEKIAGVEYCCDTISFAGRHQVISYSTVQYDDFKVKAIVQPGFVKGIRTATLNALMVKVLDAIGVENGASHIKFIVSEHDGRIYIIRVSASMGSDHIGSMLIPLTTRNDYLKMVIDVAMGQKPIVNGERGNHIFAKLRYLNTFEDRAELERLQTSESASLHHVCDEFFITAEHPREMGGFLPLEIPKGREYFDEDIYHPVRLNSARTAIWYAVKIEQPTRVWLPLFYTPHVRKVLENVEIMEYHIDEQFMPTDIDYRDTDIVVLMNYYGVTGGAVREAAARYSKVIIDNSFAFFEAPIMRDGVYNVYSCRRFFGVPDGAYLIGKLVREMVLERDISNPYVAHLVKALEFESSNAGHAANHRNEQRLAGARLKMSALTERLMQAIDYEAVKQQRKENYAILKAAFSEQMLPVETADGAVPQCFPLLASAELRTTLNQLDIHIPLLWRRALDSDCDGTAEREYADRVVCLPIDQRYHAADMAYLVKTIYSIQAE